MPQLNFNFKPRPFQSTTQDDFLPEPQEQDEEVKQFLAFTKQLDNNPQQIKNKIQPQRVSPPITKVATPKQILQRVQELRQAQKNGQIKSSRENKNGK